MKDIYYDLTEKYKGLGTTSEEADRSILAETSDTDIYTALNPDRADAAECFPWSREHKLLCLGANFGAYVGLSERVARLDIVDPAEERLELIRERYRLSGQGISEDNDSDVCITKKIMLLKEAEDSDYDVILADITGADDEWELKKDKLSFVRDACTHLKTGGTLIFIADNHDALKHKAGILPIHPELMVDLDFAEKLGEICGFAGIKRYYPLPNAAFAKNIYSDSFMPNAGSFKNIREGSFEERNAFYNDELLYSSLLEKGMFPAYAPSFAYVYTGYKQGLAENDIHFADYIRFNRTRAPKYALKTELFISEAGDRRFVRKSALSKAANAHIDSFAHKYELLSADLKERGRVVRPHTGKTGYGISYADFDFAEGTELSKLLAGQIRDGKAPEDEINKALDRVLGGTSEACHNLDALFENIIVSDNGCYNFIDYEWVCDKPLERRLVKYRILSYWYDAYKTMLHDYPDKKAFVSCFGIDAESADRYEKYETDFQRKVRGADVLNAISDRFARESASPQLIREQNQRIKELTEWNLRLQDEIDEHKTALSKERETERLSQNHIRNIERINTSQQERIKVLEARNAYLARHQSMAGRVSRRFIAAIDSWAPAESNKRRFIHYVKNTLCHPGHMLKLCCTAEGRKFIRGDFKIGGEFSEGGMLVIPKTETPLVSIVIPAYNQVAYTYACIRSVIAETDFDETPYEIILADDVSTDATVEIGTYIDGLIISRNSSNMGFLKNCNQAALKARGRYILFLNNDTKVHKYWLSSLTELAASDESIGMVGAKLVYPDGRLQEAGGIIWSDASGWNYGRLDDPSKPEYNYVKDVDYISGAAIMIKTGLWKEIGGFDEYFAPAYCEDSDLAFEVRKHGKRVVYQPRSVVTHFEGISNGTDVQGTGLKRYQLVNQDKFRTKWAAELKLQSVNTGNPDPFTAWR